jgi:hypothetical protein
MVAESCVHSAVGGARTMFEFYQSENALSKASSADCSLLRAMSRPTVCQSVKPNAVATTEVNSNETVRPPRPANRSVNSMSSLPGAVIPNAVATEPMNSTGHLRPPRPAKSRMNSTGALPGAPLPNAVASFRMNSRFELRPPRPASCRVNSNSAMPGAPLQKEMNHDHRSRKTPRRRR